MITTTLLLAAAMLPHLATAQSNQEEAFNQGMAYREDNAAIGATIRPGTADAVPGRDTARETALQGIYGQPLQSAGNARVAGCASQVPGSDAYQNQECATVNYVHRHAGERPRTTISRTEPAIATGSVVRSAPHAFTGDHPGLAGTYSACVERTTQTPVRQETERCLVGHAVTEGSCTRRLRLTYAWAPYADQAGAELRHARCGARLVRGDRLTLPPSTRFREERVRCDAQDHGTGEEILVYRIDCLGVERAIGYDARRCSAPPDPPFLDPARTPQACTTRPRTAAHCFDPAGAYAGPAEVPVFEDHWDDVDCPANLSREAIGN